jgi:large subunit ribosomal protein L18
MATQGKKVAKTARQKRKLRIRQRVEGTVGRPRLSIFRSAKHTYAQVISDVDSKTIASASTLDEQVKSTITKLAKDAKDGKSSSKSVCAARAVGLVLAERAKAAQVGQVVFDRNGFLFAGRVKALADGAREGGLNF